MVPCRTAAAALLRKLGVEHGDRVALMCFNTPGFVYAMLGAWRIGAVVVPVNHKMQAPEVDYILRHAQGLRTQPTQRRARGDHGGPRSVDHP
ncbi:AMP-binding protein [Rhodococcus opacus]|uniref:AMP-binding protein n=1 Tax=Rhodococcus opacus TaxID=37919 RepID=UPI001F545408|nr:AMP-binding protein [Rhodococcus opacus]